MKHNTYFNWSTGKDSALALYYLLNNPNYNVSQLITTVNSSYNRVTMHGLRRSLLLAQVKSIGLPCNIIELPEQPSMEDYNNIMRDTVLNLKSNGFTHAAFGDIFLEDLRTYREQQLNAMDIKAVFPIWKKDTKTLIKDFITLGFKAIVVAANEALGQSALGQEIDENFINNLPNNVDPCGENGEFHTFCYDGPIFKYPIPFTVGKHTYREYKNPDKTAKTKSGFWFCDLY